MIPTLHFSGPARHTLVQQLPLPNPSLKPWSWKARIDGDQWRGEPTITAAPKQTALYTLTFASSASSQSKGQLQLRNRTTGDELTFNLTANTTEPLAEPPITLTTQVRTTTQHELTVPNDCTTLLEYKVESDLPSLSGAATLRVPPQSSSVYAFTCRPLLAGHYAASLTFSSYYDGRLLQRFFPLHMNVAPPLPSADVRLACDAHSSVEAELEIHNPSKSDDVSFVVEVDGRYTTGDNTLHIPAASSACYTLHFAPLQPGSYTGSVSFIHPIHGEFVYRLLLEATRPAPTELPAMKVELGGEGRVLLWVSNPVDEEVKVRGGTSGEGMEAFECKPSVLLLPPRGVGRVELVYTPTRLHGQLTSQARTRGEMRPPVCSPLRDVSVYGICMAVPQECNVTFRHPRAGEWHYHISVRNNHHTQHPQSLCAHISSHHTYLFCAALCNDCGVQCLGLAPLTPLPTTSFLSFISHSAERTITFRNPYTQPTAFAFALASPATSASPFTLTAPLSTTPSTAFTYTLPPLASLPVTVTFAPSVIQTYSGSLLVSVLSSSTLQWTYPLTGVGEGVILSDVIVVECRAKEVKQLVRAIELPGAADSIDGEQLSVAMEWDDDQPPMAQPAVSVVMDGVERVDGGKTMLTVSFTFAPRKPIDVRCALVVVKAEGGRWRCPVRLIAKDAYVDDTIELEASVGAATTAQFQLRNDVDKAAAYRAYLSTSSSPCFKVAPKVGRLPPSSAATGCVLSVTFTPLDYRLEFDGVLNVETDSTLSSYALKGRLPAYKAPKQVKAKVDAGRDG